MKKNLRKGRKEMKKLEKKLLEKGLIDVDSTHTIVEDGVIKVHKTRYGSCDQCG